MKQKNVARIVLAVILGLLGTIALCTAQPMAWEGSLTYQSELSPYSLNEEWVQLDNGTIIPGYWAGNTFWEEGTVTNYEFYVDGYIRNSCDTFDQWWPLAYTAYETGDIDLVPWNSPTLIGYQAPVLQPPTLYEVSKGYDLPHVERFPAPVLGIWKTQAKAAKQLFWLGVGLETVGSVFNGWHAAELQYVGHNDNWDRADLLNHTKFVFLTGGVASSTASYVFRYERYRRPTLRGIGEAFLHFGWAMTVSQLTYRLAEDGY